MAVLTGMAWRGSFGLSLTPVVNSVLWILPVGSVPVAVDCDANTTLGTATVVRNILTGDITATVNLSPAMYDRWCNNRPNLGVCLSADGGTLQRISLWTALAAVDSTNTRWTRVS